MLVTDFLQTRKQRNVLAKKKIKKKNIITKEKIYTTYETHKRNKKGR